MSLFRPNHRTGDTFAENAWHPDTKPARFHRTDPTGRLSPLIEQEQPSTGYGWWLVTLCFAIIVMASIIREM